MREQTYMFASGPLAHKPLASRGVPWKFGYCEGRSCAIFADGFVAHYYMLQPPLPQDVGTKLAPEEAKKCQSFDNGAWKNFPPEPSVPPEGSVKQTKPKKLWSRLIRWAFGLEST